MAEYIKPAWVERISAIEIVQTHDAVVAKVEYELKDKQP